MTFSEMIELQALKLKAALAGRNAFTERAIDGHEGPEVKQMCAKVSVQLYTRLEEICNFFDITKREFIESAVADAVLIAEARSAAMGDDFPEAK